MADLTINSKVLLNNGIEIPLFGLGTWTLSGDKAFKAVLWALEAGYRLIDTASIYGNERKIGEALKASKINRDELFITTKVWTTDHGYDETLIAFKKSLKNLKLNYVDLYLIHWPDSDLRYETWKALERIHQDENARAIGVSNYTIPHLEEIFDKSSTIPVVNQVEFSPFLYQKDLLEFCEAHNIFLEAYCPLTRTRKFNDPIINSIAKKYEKTSAQILIRWGLQHNIIEIPKSGDKEHIKENANIFDFKIIKEDMDILDNLNEDYRLVENSIFLD